MPMIVGNKHPFFLPLLNKVNMKYNVARLGSGRLMKIRLKKKKQTRKHLLDVGEILLSQTAIEEFFIVDVAKHAQVSKKTIYHYFHSKQDFLLGIAGRCYQKLAQTLLKNTDSALNAFNQIKVYTSVIFAFFNQYPLYWSVLHYFQSSKTPLGHFYFSRFTFEYSKTISTSEQQFLLHYEQYLRVWLRNGIFRCFDIQTGSYISKEDHSLRNDLSPKVFALALETILGGIMNQVVERNLSAIQISKDDVFTNISQIVHDGILPVHDSSFNASKLQFNKIFDFLGSLTYQQYGTKVLDYDKPENSDNPSQISESSIQENKWEKRRYEILQLALTYFTQNDVTSFSLKSFSHECSIAKSTIYSYFSSREDMFFALAGWWYRQLNLELLRLQSKFINEEVKGIKIVMLIMWNYFQFSQNHPGFLNVIDYINKHPHINQSGDKQIIYGQLDAKRNQYEYQQQWWEFLEIWQKSIEQAHDDNSLRQDIPVPFFSFLVSSFTYGVSNEVERHLIQFQDARLKEQSIFKCILEILYQGMRIY